MARTRQRRRRLWDAYCFPGFRPQPTVHGVFGDPKARVIKLKRRSKKRIADAVVVSRWAGTIAATPGARSVVWRHAGLSRIGGAAARLPHLRQGEAGATRFSGGQSALHQTVCTLCRPAVSGSADQGGGGGIEAGLAYGQGA